MLNFVAFIGFLTFWTKCNTRIPNGSDMDFETSEKREWENMFVVQEPRMIQEGLMNRIRELEDVVYHQLHGKFVIKHHKNKLF